MAPRARRLIAEGFPEDVAETSAARLFAELEPTLRLPTEAAVSFALNEAVAESEAREVAVARALLFAILTGDVQTRDAVFRQLGCCTRDGFASVLNELVDHAICRYPRLTKTAKSQTVWMLGKLIDVRAHGCSRLVIALLRQVGTGDGSPAAAWLTSNLVSLLERNLDWAIESDELVRAAMLTCLRLASEPHGGGEAARAEAARAEAARALRAREVTLCAALWREAAVGCLGIGRDLVLAMRPLREESALAPAWQQLSRAAAATAEAEAKAAGGGVLGTPTALETLAVRVTPEAESALRFILSEVQPADGARHLGWLAERHLAGRSQAVVFDMLRWLCAYDDSGARRGGERLLGLPRWHVAAELLRQCSLLRPSAPMATVELALIFDFVGATGAAEEAHGRLEPAGALLLNTAPADGALMAAGLLLALVEAAHSALPDAADACRAAAARGLQAVLEACGRGRETSNPASCLRALEAQAGRPEGWLLGELPGLAGLLPPSEPVASIAAVGAARRQALHNSAYESPRRKRQAQG